MTARTPRIDPAERRQRRAAVEDPAVVMAAAAAFLSVRPRSVTETRRRLRHLGYRHDLIDGVLERLADVGYLDDEAFARAWVESRDRARPRGAGALRQELTLKGVDRALIDIVLAERTGEAGTGLDRGQPTRAASDGAAAGRLLARREVALARETDLRKRRQKAYALLARNGFSPDDIAAALGREVVSEPGLE
jgi:regulatory protein